MMFRQVFCLLSKINLKTVPCKQAKIYYGPLPLLKIGNRNFLLQDKILGLLTYVLKLPRSAKHSIAGPNSRASLFFSPASVAIPFAYARLSKLTIKMKSSCYSLY